MLATQTCLDDFLERRMPDAGAGWLEKTVAEIGTGASGQRLAALLSMASRHAPRGPLGPSAAERDEAGRALAGWDPERWTTLDAVRVRMVLAHPAIHEAVFPDLLEECFRYADVGELVALYRCLGHLPDGRRFVWRAGEGCRTNMRSVFEATACDTPYPVSNFDDDAWHQLVIKAVFIEAPLWRVYGLDGRLSAELARMALDLADERRSAGRRIPPDLLLCIGSHGSERALQALAIEAASNDACARRAAALALGRAGATDRLRAWPQEESDVAVRAAVKDALDGRCDQIAFAVFEAGRD